MGALRTLSRKLNPAVGWLSTQRNVRRLRVAPDGMLNLVPFAGVFDERGHYLIERFAISYLSASRYGSSGNAAVGRGVAADSGGNLVTTGNFGGTVNFGTGSLTSAGSNDIFLLKLAP